MFPSVYIFASNHEIVSLQSRLIEEKFIWKPLFLCCKNRLCGVLKINSQPHFNKLVEH